MELFKLKTFIRAIELGSFSKAAEELSYTPSALSHMTTALEKELGVILVERSFAGIELTEHGKRLFPLFEEIVEKEEAIYSLAGKLSDSALSIRIGSYSSLSKFYLPEMIKEFNEIYPEAKISIVVDNSFTNGLKNVDIIFSDKIELNNSEWLPLFEDEYVVVARPGLFAGKAQVSREDLYEYPFIMPDDAATESVFDKKLAKRIDVTSDDDASIISMVKNGLGITILPSLSVQNQAGKIEIIQMSPPLTRTLGIIYHKRNNSFMTKKFIHFVVKKSRSKN